MEAKLARLLEYQRALATFSRMAPQTIPSETLLQHACAQIARVTHIKHTKALRYRPHHGDLLIVAGVGWKPGVVGVATLALDAASPPGRSLQTATAVIVEDFPDDSEFRLSPLLRDHGIVALLNVPIMIDGQSWGVLEVDSNKARSFDEAEIGFLTAFANIIGTALSRYQAQEEMLKLAQEHTRAEAVRNALVAELRHRMKNNLQTITSFVSVQRRNAQSEETRERLTSIMERVHAIALAHDQLSPRDGMSHVDFDSYLRSLCANIAPRDGAVSVIVDASPVPLPLDRAVPAGLIVNELVTNAFKYAFEEGKDGSVYVSFSIDGSFGEASIIVADNGKGMGPRREGGLGLTLVDTFARQLDGRVEREPADKGTRVRISFPLTT